MRDAKSSKLQDRGQRSGGRTLRPGLDALLLLTTVGFRGPQFIARLKPFVVDFNVPIAVVGLGPDRSFWHGGYQKSLGWPTQF